jgi:hypothetical protein
MVKSLLYPLLMKAKDCKFICLSGTPIVGNPFELAPMYNILRGPLKDGHQAFPDDENAFNSHFVDYTTNTFRNVDLMMRQMVGLNSYFVGITEDKDRAIFPDRKDHVLNLTTKPYQTWHHDKVLEQELGAKGSKKKGKLVALPGGSTQVLTMSSEQDALTPKGSYHTRSRAASNFVFPLYVHRPRSGTKDVEILDDHLFEFQLPDGSAVKTLEHYEVVWKELLENIEIDDDDDDMFEQLIKDGKIGPNREFLSEQFMVFEHSAEILSKNGGFPTKYSFHKCLSDKDINMIDRTVGDYKTRIKLALADLGTPPPGKVSVFALAALKHYSIKMYAIYKTLTSDKKAGAPHVVDINVDARHDPIHAPAEYEANYIDEQVTEIDPETEEIKLTLSTKVKLVNDKDDPLNRKEFADVFLTDAQLKARGKKVVGGPSLVYSYFSSAEGAAIFSMVLEAHGFENFNNSTQQPKDVPRRKRFAFFRGGMDYAMKKNIIRVFNSKENVHGQLIRVIFVTQAAAEGISLYNLRQIHIMEPHWDNVMIEQVIGRGFRLLAHKYIDDPDEREINVFRYFTVRPQKEVLDTWASNHGLGDSYYANLETINDGAMMADHMIQSIADKKDIFRLKLNDIRIKVAVDCYLNHEYNKPKDGCFKYHDKNGPAYGTSIKADVSEVKSEIQTEKVAFVTIKRGKNKLSKHYIRYPARKPTRLKFDKTGDQLYEAIELYGPIDAIPASTDGYVIPEGALLGGYYHALSKKFIPVGSGTVVPY